MVHRIIHPLTQPLFGVSRKNMFFRKPPQGPVTAETDRIHEERSGGVIEIREAHPTALQDFIGGTWWNQGWRGAGGVCYEQNLPLVIDRPRFESRKKALP